MIASVSRTKEWILASCEKNVKTGNHQGRTKPRGQIRVRKGTSSKRKFLTVIEFRFT